MLSIGKMVTGAEEYYLSVVAAGREDYYTGTGEAPGVWLGQGSASLGLRGQVGAGQLRVLLAGFSPTDGSRLTGKPVGAAQVTGFDLTFSAPKSVSVLWGLAPAEISDAVRRGHDRAVVDALGYLEGYATRARRGAGGLRRIGATGLVAAAFRHRTSRAGDPQLHTHVLVANAVGGDDGRWSAPDARLLYFHARTAGFVYQAALRAELVRSVGVSFGPVVQSSAEVLGMAEGILALFSTRRAHIEAVLERHGAHGARAAQLATLAPGRPNPGSTPTSRWPPGRWPTPGVARRWSSASSPAMCVPSSEPLAVSLSRPRSLTASAKSSWGREVSRRRPPPLNGATWCWPWPKTGATGPWRPRSTPRSTRCWPTGTSRRTSASPSLLSRRIANLH
jgi:conjugative relaxase-like TrwC/TraI family protein